MLFECVDVVMMRKKDIKYIILVIVRVFMFIYKYVVYLVDEYVNSK